MKEKGKRMKSSNKQEQFTKFTNFMKTNKRSLLIISSIILALVIIGAMYAYFSDIVNASPIISTGHVDVELQEDYPFNTEVGEYGAAEKVKTFRAVSNSTIDCYVRAQIIPIIEYFDVGENAWFVANIPVSDIKLKQTAPDWAEENSYYYYKYILRPDDVSTDFVVEIENVVIPDNLKTEKIRVTIKVILESAQAEFDAWMSIFDIEELPPEVVHANDFSYIMSIPENNKTYTMSLPGGYNYNFEVDWGDGNKNTVTSQVDINKTHTYAIERRLYNKGYWYSTRRNIFL